MGITTCTPGLPVPRKFTGGPAAGANGGHKRDETEDWRSGCRYLGMALARMLTVSGNEVQVWSAIEAEVDNLSTTRVHPTCRA